MFLSCLLFRVDGSLRDDVGLAYSMSGVLLKGPIVRASSAGAQVVLEVAGLELSLFAMRKKMLGGLRREARFPPFFFSRTPSLDVQFPTKQL